METTFTVRDTTLFWSLNGETLWLEPWGPDAVRVRATERGHFDDMPGALAEPPEGATQSATEAEPLSRPATVQMHDGSAELTNGLLRVLVDADGRLHFYNSRSGTLLTEEPVRHFYNPPQRNFRATSSDLYHLECSFAAQPGERFYGLGQHQHGRLDQKGCVIELQQRNTEVCIPFTLSSRGYGFLWNNPAVGRVELAENATRWVAEVTRQLDYVVIAGDTPADVIGRYVAMTGRPPLLPEWALGFWQCKLRYRTQDELLGVAREYRRRGLPLAVIVVDYFHWTMMGDWQFDPAFWPDPGAMVKELKSMGVELMVSVWATVNRNSVNYEEMQRRGLLVCAERGLPGFMSINDRFPAGPSNVIYYDATNPEARAFVWDKVRRNYHDLGIRVLWLDADEPEIYPMHHDNLRFALGNGMEVSSIYPLLHQKGFYEGMREVGEQEFVFLSRSAWAGSQRYGASVWSGDIPSTFESLHTQIRAGLNIAVSGIPWWTTDIGGFRDGDIRDPQFQELIVRWFQYGVFCPLFRLHGVRQPLNGEEGAMQSGAPNEIWSFGDMAYGILKSLLFLREKLKPYLMELNRRAHEQGLPPMRPLFVDFPTDVHAWEVEDEFLLGPDLLVAPSLDMVSATGRSVYRRGATGWTPGQATK